jgi:hypothetical protein
MVVPCTSSPWQRAQFRLNCFHPSYTAGATVSRGAVWYGSRRGASAPVGDAVAEGAVAEGAEAEDSGAAAVAVSDAGGGLGVVGLACGFGAGFLGAAARGAGEGGAEATTLSGRRAVSLTEGAVSGGRVVAVSAPDTTVVSVGTEPDRRSPPQPATVAEASRKTAQSWTLQPLIIMYTLSIGGRRPGHLPKIVPPT